MAYTPSEKVLKQEKDYYAHLYNNKPGEFSSEYTDKVNKVITDIENRGEFKYNPATDKGYQAARKQYTQGGQQAMKDTLGTATELTGGYDNSYAQTAAQQTYNKYMGELAALMPQYEGQAYDRYITEGQQMKDYLGILNNALDRDYARHQDKMNAYNADADRLYGQYMDAYNTDYGMYRDNVADQQYADEIAYRDRRDAIEDQRYADEWALTQEQWAHEQQQYADQWALQQEQWAYQQEQDAADRAFQQEQWAYQKAQAKAEAKADYLAALAEYRSAGDSNTPEITPAIYDEFAAAYDENADSVYILADKYETLGYSAEEIKALIASIIRTR